MRVQAAVTLRAATKGLTSAARTARPSAAPQPHRLQLPNRSFSLSSSLSAAPPSSSSSSSLKAKDAASIPKGPIRDEAILTNSSYVRLVDPKSGALAGPFNTKQILSKLDRSKFWIQQVAPPQPSRATIEYDPSAPAGSVHVSVLVQFPICKLIEKKQEFDKVRAAKRKSSSSSGSKDKAAGGFGEVRVGGGAALTAVGTSKEVQLTWSVSPNDLAHKLSKAKKDMLKGARINIVVTTKSGGKKYIKGLNPKEDEKREELLRQIESFLCSAPAAGEANGSGGAGVEGGEQAAATGVGATEPIARRLQDVDWQRGGSAAVMSFECFRK